MTDPAFFGFGSLVNLATHDYMNPRTATLNGWQRKWVPSLDRGIALLTVEPAKDSKIAGIIADVPNADWAALDEREFAYTRTDVTAQLGTAHPTAVYQTRADMLAPAGTLHPILLSYLDVVVQGYHQQFGTAGVADFFASTDGWSTSVLDDRADPRYPRHQHLRADERALVDDHLLALSAQVQKPV